MAIIDDETKTGTNNARIDSMFDDDHYVCCTVKTGYSGFTIAYCGESVVCDGSDIEEADWVACVACDKAASAGCPLGYECEDIDDDDQ